jgi:hypothetical protein
MLRPAFHICLFLSLLVLLSFQAGAQTYSNKESFRYSFTAGLTSSNLMKDSVKYRPGIYGNAGITAALVLNERINLGLEGLFSGKAFKQDSPIVKYRFFYLDFPLYIQYKLGDGSIRVNAGAQYSKFIGSRKVELDPNSANGVHQFNYVNIKDMDYSLLIGAEADLLQNLSFGARYTISTSAFAENGPPAFGVFQFSLSYVGFRSYRQLFSH